MLRVPLVAEEIKANAALVAKRPSAVAPPMFDSLSADDATEKEAGSGK